MWIYYGRHIRTGMHARWTDMTNFVIEQTNICKTAKIDSLNILADCDA
jgi:hypothetical protein